MNLAASWVDQARITLRSGLSSAAATGCLPQKRGRLGSPPDLVLFLRAMAAPMRASLRLGKSLGVERIARRAHRADDIGLAQRQAQPTDMDVDGAQFDILAVRPHRVEQLLAREDPARIFEEVAQQAIF